MKEWDKSWEQGTAWNARPAPQPKRLRTDLPRGGKEIAAQIGTELRMIFTPADPGGWRETQELLARLDRWDKKSN